MDLRTELEYFRKEHEDILRFVGVWEEALNLAASDTDEERRQGLAALRRMEARLAAIQNHCQAEEENVESPYRLYLRNAQAEQLNREHDQLRRLIENLLSELRFATVARTAGVVSQGHELGEFIRQHIAYEEDLLSQIQSERAAREKLLLRYTRPGG